MYHIVWDDEDIAIVDGKTLKHYWIIEKNKPMDEAIYNLVDSLNKKED